MPAGVVHRFEEFTDDLAVWVVFYGPEGGEVAAVSAEARASATALERTLHRDYYLSDQVFARERERIFCREWFCAAREEELPAPGDYLVSDVAGESMLVVRTRDGGLAAHYNVCRHRGSQLVPDGGARAASAAASAVPITRGPTRSRARCAPRRSWRRPTGSPAAISPSIPVGVESWGGFIFLHLTPEEAKARGQTLHAQLGGVPERLRRYPLGELRVARRIEYEVAANWKVMLENYNECYHCGPVHPELCRLVPAFKQRGGAELDWERGIPHREGAWTFTASGTTNRAPFAGLSEDERMRHKGELVYPNLLLSLSRRARGRLHHLAARARAHHRGLRVPVPSRRDGQAGIRPGRRGGFLGPGEPAGLGHLRVGAAGNDLAGLPDRILRADGECSLDIRRYVGERLGEE